MKTESKTTEKPVTTKVELDGPELTEYDDDTTLMDFIEELTDVLNQIPEEYRKQAMIRGGGEYSTCTYVNYERPENDEEQQRRLAREAVRRIENETRDREQLARLKARYEA
jgi:hypothetical protein